MKLTVDDVSRLFNVSEKTIYRWIKTNEFPACRVNNQYRFNRTDLMEWAAAHRVNLAPILADGAAAGKDAAPLPTLAEALEAGGVFYRVAGHDKAAVLREVVALLRLPERVDREMMLQILLAREEMGSTAIGEGIAIPHVRNPIVLSVIRPTITLYFLEKPVDFGALDGQPVGILFSLISPTIQAHLHLLSRLTYALRNWDFRDVVVNHGSRDEIFQMAQRIEGLLAPAAAPPSRARLP